MKELDDLYLYTEFVNELLNELLLTNNSVIEASIIELFEEYIQIPSRNGKIYEKSKLTTGQQLILNAIEEYDNTVILKDRQVGASTILNFIIACRLISNEKWNILELTCNSQISSLNIKKIREYICLLTDKLSLPVEYITNNSCEIKLSNGNYVKSSPIISVEQMCSCEIEENSWIIFEETSYAKYANLIYKIIKDKTKDKNVSFTIISSQNGIDDLFFPIYVLGKKAGFNRVRVTYHDTEFMTDKKILSIKNMCSDTMFEKEFGGKFIINNDIEVKYFIRKIEEFLLPEESFTMRDLFELYKSNLIKNVINN